MSKFRFELGDKVRDRVTEFEGIIVVRSQHLNMCNRYAVQPQGIDKDGKIKDAFNIDEDSLELIKAQAVVPIMEQQAASQDKVTAGVHGGPSERVPAEKVVREW